MFFLFSTSPEHSINIPATIRMLSEKWKSTRASCATRRVTRLGIVHSRVPFNNDSQCAKNMWCRCGHDRCEGVRCKEFVKWCHDPVDESDLQTPTLKYLECECGAGVCRRVKATRNVHAVKYCFTCPVKQLLFRGNCKLLDNIGSIARLRHFVVSNHGSCGYLMWEDELLDNESIRKQDCKRIHNGFGEGDQNDQTDNDLGECNAIEKEELLLSSLSATSRICGRQNVPDASFGGSSPMGWLGCLLFFCPPQSLKPVKVRTW
ncbi:hypothetical protein CR513_17638, partial [Mucuna pruriens]